MTNSTFHNLPVFDMVCMLALLFMAFMLLRAEETKSTTMPVLTSLVKEDSTNFWNTTYQSDSLMYRLASINEDVKRSSDLLEIYKHEFTAIWNNLEFRRALTGKISDIFMLTDALMHMHKALVKILNKSVSLRDSLLQQYIKVTQIEISTLDEDLLLFPVDQAVPYPIHEVTHRRIDDILADICDTVDVYIERKKYKVVKVIGHTDETGTAKRNRILSQQRAEYLAQKIREHIERKYGTEKPYLVQPIGYGKFSPLPRKKSEDIRAWWQRCRRVDLVFGNLQRF